MHSKSQNLSKICGHIKDKITGEPVFNVNVFLENTTLGTITQYDGSYCLENIPLGSYNLIISHIGYKLVSEGFILFETDSITKNFYLEPRYFKGEEVKVIARYPKKWKRDLKKFTKLFIGTSKNAKQCKIMNPEVLDFKKDLKTHLFIASTDSILCVQNKAFGYRLYIILKDFEWNGWQDKLIWSFSARSEEMEAQDEKERKKWLSNRRRSYDGSFKHFLAALACHQIEKEKYVLYHTNSPGVLGGVVADLSLPMDESYVKQAVKIPFGHPKLIKSYQTEILTPDTLGRQQFYFENYLNVVHLKTKRKDSWIKLYQGKMLIDTLGNYYSLLPIHKWGYWSDARVADLLPLNYSPFNREKE